MPQSILLVAAALILGTMGLTRHRAHVAAERAVVTREMESAALVVAERWAGQARARAFDEADVNAPEARVRDDVAGLSAVLGPDPGEVATDPSTFDDADDFHGFVTRDTVSLGTGDPVRFDVRLAATYARRSDWSPLAARSTYKVVTVTVTEAAPNRGRSAASVAIPIRLTPARQYLLR